MELTDHDKGILQAVIDGKDIVFNRTDRKNPEPASVFHIFAVLTQGMDLSGYEVKPETAAEQVPSDEELIALGNEEQFFLFCSEEEFLDIAKTVLRRYCRGRR